MATHASPLAAVRNRRVVLLVALAAAVAAAAVVGGTLLQSRGERTTVPGAVTSPRPGRPPLQLELGLRTDAEARALAQAVTLFDRKHEAGRAAAIFRRYDSLEARLGVLFAGWSGPASLAAVQKLAAAHPGDPAALLNLGWADYWAGRNADAVAAWEQTAKLHPDSPYAVDAEDALHPATPVGLPPIVTGLALPPSLAKLSPAAKVAVLRRAARRPDVRAKLLYGVTLWNLKRPVSAERELAAAAKLAPHDALARAAAAVALFSKADPTRAFAKLGPLTGVFPDSAAVQFHLGLLLIYIDERKKAVQHLRAALADGPHSPFAAPARTLLASLASAGSSAG